ncbi:MAG: hypothetical protein JSW52_05710 [Candidatus Coatesbacteria bacterium]|nr:MAG: hypothetical protein JSW52_05710 [Candidatus Coatesbacteria bacterium]
MDKQKLTLTAGLLSAALGIKLIANVVYSLTYLFTGAGDLFGGDYSIYVGATARLIVYPAWYAFALTLLVLLVVAAAASAARGGRAAYFWLAAVDGFVVISAVIAVVGTIITFAVGALAGGTMSLLPMLPHLLDGLAGLFSLGIALVPTYLLIAYFRKAIPKKITGDTVSPVNE